MCINYDLSCEHFNESHKDGTRRLISGDYYLVAVDKVFQCMSLLLTFFRMKVITPCNVTLLGLIYEYSNNNTKFKRKKMSNSCH